MSDLIHGARVDGDAPILNVRLGADPVKLVFNKKLVGHRSRDVSEIGGGRGQHELDGMKQAHAYVLEIVSSRTHGRFANVAEQHVYLRHGRERTFKSASDRVFNQTFAQDQFADRRPAT